MCCLLNERARKETLQILPFKKLVVLFLLLPWSLRPSLSVCLLVSGVEDRSSPVRVTTATPAPVTSSSRRKRSKLLLCPSMLVVAEKESHEEDFVLPDLRATPTEFYNCVGSEDFPEKRYEPDCRFSARKCHPPNPRRSDEVLAYTYRKRTNLTPARALFLTRERHKLVRSGHHRRFQRMLIVYRLSLE